MCGARSARGGEGGGAGACSRVCLSSGAALANASVAAAAALRSRGLGVLRFPRRRRPSIIDRDGFYVRYGDRERQAVASFDFLDDLCKDCN